MRRSLLPLALMLLTVPLLAAPRTTHQGQRWTLENSALKVDIDAPAGRFQVLDKAAGYLWRGPDGAPATPTLLVPEASSAPVVDGTLDEWADRGALIELNAGLLTEGARPANAADSSARARLLWSAQGLFIALDVKDDKLLLPAPDEAQWWEKDSVEFWLDGTQYGVRLGDRGDNLWASTGSVAGAQIAHRRTADGYQLEVRLTPPPGKRLRFALGLNDCDGAGRESQLYYPTGWAHSNPNTFTEVVLADAQGNAPAERPDLRPKLTPVGDKPGEATFALDIQAGKTTYPGEVTFRLLGDTPELQLVLDKTDRATATGRFGVLHPLVLDRPGRILGAAYNNGIGVPTDDMSWRGRSWATWASLDMPWVGLTDGKIGYMVLWELPVSCDNGMAVFEAATTGDKTLLVPSASHEPIRGQFGATRVIRYSFCATGGHVAICKRFRSYIKGQGMLVTQREKLRKKPHLAKLLGAPDIWGRSDLKFCQEARAAGIDRMILNSAQPAKDMEKIKAMGFLMGRYDNYEDAFEKDNPPYGDFVEADDVVILHDGSRMKAWNTKGDNPKQFMKRCSAMFEPVARRYVPTDLGVYPYDTRFLDVTTATGLQECYHPKHAHDRMSDREDKRKLARYVGTELNLVLGGEHGRWWGADLFDYWEGMQSGGFYSWPAGYVGEDLPDSREKIGKQYLEWGLGEKHRYPLWELVYHDCVVSTWYWGDSTGHLVVAPELGVKQDAFNVLYGTIPLYWVAQPYSYNWSKPEQRARLLESYRNTCKLHEQIGFDEMISHEFATEDRAVQHTVFADGTNVWVNFGEKAWTLKQGAKSYALPQYGFYAKGPKIEQWRTAQGDRIVTCICGDDYLYASESIPGLIEFTGGGVTCKVEAPGRLRVSLSADTKGLRLDARALCPGKREGAWHMIVMGTDGEPARLTPLPAGKSAMLSADTPGQPSFTLLAPEVLAGHAELMWRGLQPWGPPGTTKQGMKVAVTGNLRNLGGKAAQTTVRLMTRTAPAVELATQKVNVPASGGKAVSFQFDSALYDGEVPLELVVADGAGELCVRDNRLAFALDITPEWSRWDGHVDLNVSAATALPRPVARLPFDLKAERAKLSLPGDADLDSVRVVATTPTGDAQCPAQIVGPDLVFQIPAGMTAGASLPCRVYFDRAEPKRHRATSRSCWNADRTTFDNGFYSVRFGDGAISAVSLGETQILSHLATSSKDTGWVEETGTVDSFEVLADGPVCTQVRVKKQLPPNHSYDKLYSFYPTHFTVTVLSPEIYGTMSRAYYLADASYEDDKGNTAAIDGKGDAENVYGKNPKPQWYATWGPGWALNGIAVSTFDNVCYWDGGNKAGLGFVGPPSKDGQTVAYVLHALTPTSPKPTDLARADREQLLKPVAVTRK